jgi:hypothetical protein
MKTQEILTVKQQREKRQEAITKDGPCPCGCRNFETCALFNDEKWAVFIKEIRAGKFPN